MLVGSDAVYNGWGLNMRELTWFVKMGMSNEQALETASLMLGSDKSRGYTLEMICADFLAGANLETGNTDALMTSLYRLFDSLPLPRRQEFLDRTRIAL